MIYIILWLACSVASVYVENLYFPFFEEQTKIYWFDLVILIMMAIVSGPLMFFYILSVYYMAYGKPSEKEFSPAWYESKGLFR